MAGDGRNLPKTDGIFKRLKQVINVLDRNGSRDVYPYNQKSVYSLKHTLIAWLNLMNSLRDPAHYHHGWHCGQNNAGS